MMNIVMRRLLFFILVILIFSAREAISEEAVVHGVKYRGEVRVRVPVPGISFIVPLEWEGFLSQDEDIFFLLSDTKPGYMCATWKTGTSPEDMRDYLYQYLPGEDDQILVPAGLPEADECGAAVFRPRYRRTGVAACALHYPFQHRLGGQRHHEGSSGEGILW